MDAAAELDEAEAAAQLGADLGASTPVVEDADGPLELRSSATRCSCSAAREVVANDVRLDGARPGAGGLRPERRRQDGDPDRAWGCAG